MGGLLVGFRRGRGDRRRLIRASDDDAPESSCSDDYRHVAATIVAVVRGLGDVGDLGLLGDVGHQS